MRGIDIKVGRNGEMKKVERMEKIKVGGVVVKKEKMKNEEYIKGIGKKGEKIREGRDIRIGDRVIVKREGDVIKKIVDVVIEEGKKRGENYKFKNVWKEWGRNEVREEGEEVRRWKGGMIWNEKEVERIRNFV